MPAGEWGWDLGKIIVLDAAGAVLIGGRPGIRRYGLCLGCLGIEADHGIYLTQQPATGTETATGGAAHCGRGASLSNLEVC